MGNLSIKKRLLIYGFLIQLFVIIIFSLLLYRSLYNSTVQKIESTLKVIILDIEDSFIEKKQTPNSSKALDKEKEYQFKPLFIRLIKFDKNYKIVKSTIFPKKITVDFSKFKMLKKSEVVFENQYPYFISTLKIKINKKSYILELATNDALIKSQEKDFIDRIFFIIPIILFLATLGGYFLVYKAFEPIEKILINLRSINANDLSKRLSLSSHKNDEINMLVKEINNLLERLELSFERISQFSSDVSHELKTPLTIMRGEMEVGLRKERSSKEYKEILKSSISEILVIKRTINYLLFLAKSEQHSKHISKKDIYIDEITLESIDELNSFAQKESIEIVSKITNAMQINGYETLLKLAIQNILKNAISFSFPHNQVIVENYLSDNDITISVQDFGIGIAKNEQKKVFEKFYRTDKSRNKNTGGTGLGMAIAQKIVKMHNGKIEIISEIDKGTTILIKFALHLEKDKATTLKAEI